MVIISGVSSICYSHGGRGGVAVIGDDRPRESNPGRSARESAILTTQPPMCVFKRTTSVSCKL